MLTDRTKLPPYALKSNLCSESGSLAFEILQIHKLYLCFSSAILKLGQRIPLAYRFSKMLESHVDKRCGEGYCSTLRIGSSRPINESPPLHALPRESTLTDLTSQIVQHKTLNEPGSFLALA